MAPFGYLGETESNRLGIIQGQLDIPLSQVGIRQATLASRRLENEYFTHAYTSDLKRASETAQIILENNKKNKCELVYDERLRERCFGAAQGRPCKELAAAAKKVNKSIIDYIPEGAESTVELRVRAKSFFSDLCKFVIELSLKEEADYIPASIRQRNVMRDYENGNDIKCSLSNGNAVNSNKNEFQEVSISENQSLAGDLKADNNQKSTDVSKCDDSIDNSKKRRKCEDHVEMVRKSAEKVACFNIDEDVATPAAETVSEVTKEVTPLRSESSSSSGYYSLSDAYDDSENTNSESIPAVEELLQESVDDESPSSDTGNFIQDTPGGLNAEVASYMSLGTGIKCPNVSVNPSSGRRITRVSSISSGRNNSFDDLESLPIIADILVTSHGGLLKEFVRHFVDDLHCRIPGGRAQSLCVCPNTGISKYIVTMDDADQVSMITCLLFHDREHLNMEGK